MHHFKGVIFEGLKPIPPHPHPTQSAHSHYKTQAYTIWLYKHIKKK